MQIYIDESGSFVSACHSDAWNVVSAYMCPESDKKRIKEIITKIKIRYNMSYKDEIKLKSIDENVYFKFLFDLHELKGRIIPVATDSSLMTDETIVAHKKKQVKKILEHKGKIISSEGQRGADNLADKITSTSPQLYVQLICQVELIAHVMDRGILYFVQKTPKNLKKFNWLIDQKNLKINNYEEAFKAVTPGFLQTRSIERPFISCTDFDYSSMEHFFYTKENKPTYLKELYGIDTGSDGGIDLGKLFWDNVSFVDSKKTIGIQIADLLASGVRRMLRGGFDDNNLASRLLGRLMIEPLRSDFPINLVSLVDSPINSTHVIDSLLLCRNEASQLLRPKRG